MFGLTSCEWTELMGSTLGAAGWVSLTWDSGAAAETSSPFTVKSSGLHRWMTLQEVLQFQLPLALGRGSQWAVLRPSLNQRPSSQATRQENKLIESIISITAYPRIGTGKMDEDGGRGTPISRDAGAELSQSRNKERAR